MLDSAKKSSDSTQGAAKSAATDPDLADLVVQGCSRRTLPLGNFENKMINYAAIFPSHLRVAVFGIRYDRR